MEENKWFDFDEAMKELKADENKVYLDPSKKETDEVAIKPQGRERIHEDFYDNEEYRRRIARENLAKREAKREDHERAIKYVENSKRVKENMGENLISINQLKQNLRETNHTSRSDFSQRVSDFKERLAANPITEKIKKINILKYPPEIKVSIALIISLAGGCIVYDAVFNKRPELHEQTPAIERVYEEALEKSNVDAIDSTAVTLSALENISDNHLVSNGTISPDPNNIWGMEKSNTR